MQQSVLIDYELAVARQGYIVRALLKLEGKAPDAGDADSANSNAQVPLNLALVLDRSGSMAGEKLARAREAAVFLVRRLRANDAVGVVSYDENVRTEVSPTEGSASDHIVSIIEEIQTGGSTNLSGGWIRGHELVAGRKAHVERAEGAEAKRAALHRILLLTDGLANVGITDARALVGLCRAAAEKGVTTTTIGFGGDYDEELLRAMADAGGGNAYYIERPDQAPGVFEEEIEGLLTVSAQNVTVDVRPSTAVQLTAVHNGYPSHETAEGMRVDVGDLYAREPRSLLLEFFVPGLDERETVAIAEVVVGSYVVTANGGVAKQEERLPIVSSLSGAGVVDPEVRRELLVMEAARAREEAVELSRRGDDGGAADILRSSARALHEAAPVYGAPFREQATDLEELASRLESNVFSAADAKYSAQRAYNARRGKHAYEEKISRRRGGE